MTSTHQSLRESIPLEPGHSDDLSARLKSAYASRDRHQIAAALSELHDLRFLAERLAAPAGIPDEGLGEMGVQSTQYMIDMIPWIQRYIAKHRRGRTFEVLDVGPGSGHGTALLARLYRGARLGYRMRVAALDISATYQWFIPTIAPEVRFIREDIYVHRPVYDIVIASHVIEHVPEPVKFVRRLQELARFAVFISAPFKEPAERITKGHVNIIDDDFVKELKPAEWASVNSVAWGAFYNPPYEMLIARLPGTAPLPTPDAADTP